MMTGPRFAAFSPSHPSAARFRLRLGRAATALAQAGYQLQLPEAVFASADYTAGSAQARADAFNALVDDSTVDGILAVLGGFNTNALLPFIDYAALRRSPKQIVGASDFSALLLAVNARTGIETYHGPALLPDWGEIPAPPDYTVAGFRKALSGSPFDLSPSQAWTADRGNWDNPEQGEPRPPRHASRWHCLRAGEGRGTLYGGNLATVNALLGTDYWRPPSRPLVFIEATASEARLPRLERALVQLIQARLFDNAVGLLVGRMPDARPEAEKTLHDMLREVFAHTTFPIAAELDFGHSSPTATLPIGRVAHLTCKRQGIGLTFESRREADPLQGVRIADECLDRSIHAH